MAVNKVQYGGTTLIDLTADTLTSPSQLAEGIVAHDRAGNVITGTASGGTSAISVVDTLDSHGGTVRTITALDISDTTAVASDVLNSKWFYTADGTKTQGTATGGGSAVTVIDETLPNGATAKHITAVDISNDTVTASHLEQGYTAHDASGNAILGTLVAGGGGLEYESGTWTPSEDIARPTINFTNTHTTKPIFVMMADATGTDDTTQSSNHGFVYGSYHSFTGQAVPSNATSSCRYALASYSYRGTGNPAQAVNGIINLEGSSSSSDEYWVSTTGFIPSSASTTRYWRTGRTYKWIAVWAPTT